MHKTIYRAALLIAAAWPTVALAQPAPPAGNVEERARQQIRLPKAEDGEDALMSGDSDIVLLRRTRLFNVHGAVNVSATDNAYLSPGQAVGDGFAQVQAGLGFATRIGGKVDVFADASLVTLRYFDETSLDYSAFSGVVGVGTSFGKVNVSAVYQPSVVFSRDFSTRKVTSHRFRLTASTGFKLGRIGIEPEVHGERTVSDPDAYNAWSGGGSVTLSAQPAERLPLLVFAQLAYDRRVFDDYFEAFVGVKRKDDTLGASAGLVWRPKGWVDIRASYSFGRNWSTSDINGYRAHSGTLGVSTSLRF